MSEEQEQVIFKLVLLGDGMVGKTSIRQRYLGKEFSTSYLATLGADFAIKELTFKNYLVRYQIWDLAGQPRFNQLRRAFYLGAQGGIVIYDISNRDSLNNVQNWITEFFQNNGKGAQPIVLIGNKKDLREKGVDTIARDEGEKVAGTLASELDIPVPFVEVSAMTGENIEEAFQLITSYYFETRLNL